MSVFNDAVDLIKAEYDRIASNSVDQFLIGEKYLHEQRAPTDVVWVNPGGEFAPNPGAGFEEFDDNSAASPMLFNDVAAFSCFTWGNDESQAKTIMVDIIRSASQIIGWENFKISDYVAVTEDEEKGGYCWSGFSYALRGSVVLIMVRESMVTREVTIEVPPGEFE